MKPRKPVEVLRVPLNCLIEPRTKELLAGIQNLTGESQGQVIDRLVAEGYESASTSLNTRAGKVSKQERVIRERAATHVATLDAVGPTLNNNTGKASIESWRATRKPLLKPSQR